MHHEAKKRADLHYNKSQERLPLINQTLNNSLNGSRIDLNSDLTPIQSKVKFSVETRGSGYS